ncbi:MAG: 6-phospho-3-hexuloisomerase [Candidatus Altiarchaeota archaeon]
MIPRIMSGIADHVKKVASTLDAKDLELFVDELIKAERIFLFGAGRSGLVAKAFAMRLSQLGLRVYVVGETITPGMRKDGDLFVLVSGSGETKSVVSAAKVAHNIGTRIASITSYRESSLGQLSDHVVVVKGKTRVDIEKDHLKHQIEGIHSSLTPMGTLFEDTVLVLLDGVIGDLMNRTKKAEHEMRGRHANV